MPNRIPFPSLPNQNLVSPNIMMLQLALLFLRRIPVCKCKFQYPILRNWNRIRDIRSKAGTKFNSPKMEAITHPLLCRYKSQWNRTFGAVQSLSIG